MVDHQQCDSDNSSDNGNQDNAAECTDFEAKLIELQDEMNQDIADLEYQKRKQKNSATEFKELEKIFGEISTIVSAYSNARENLQKGLDKQENYYCKKNDMIIAVVGEKKSDIKKAIDDCEAKIDQLECLVTSKKTAKENAKDCLDTAQQLLNTRTACFMLWKERKQDTEKIITSLNELQSEIERKELESKFAVMYYLLTKFCKALNEFKDGDENCSIDSIVEDDEIFSDGLKTAWCELHAAKKDFNLKQDEYDEAVRMLETAEVNLQTAKDQLESCIIQKLEEIDIDCVCS